MAENWPKWSPRAGILVKFYMEMTPCGLMVPKKKKIGPHSKQDMLATGDLGLSLFRD